MNSNDQGQGSLWSHIDGWLRHPRWGGIGGVLGLIGVVLAVVTLWLTGVLSGSSIHRLRLGQAGVSGPLTITPRRVECGKSIKDVKDRETREPLQFAPLKGQLCFVRMQLYDSSVEETQANGQSHLFVNGKGFPGLTSVPARLPLLFPGTATTITVVYNLPAEVLPSELTVQAERTFQEKGPEWGPDIHYDVTGAVTG